MKPIEIYNAKSDVMSAEHTETVAALLATVNGKATSFTLRNLDQVARIAQRVELALDNRGLRQDLRAGIEVDYTPAGPVAGSYSHGALTTQVTLKRTSTGIWKLTAVERVTVYPKSRERRIIRVSQAAVDYIRDKAAEPFTAMGGHADKAVGQP